MSDAKSVILIDGHDKDRQYYAHRLSVSSPDYQIFEAANGQSGLKLYKACDIDCVVLELHLPDMSGFDVLVQLVPVARRPEIPVVVLTRFNNQGLLEIAKMNGAFATLQKSTTAGDDLDRVLRQAMATITRDGKKRNDSAPFQSVLRP